MPLYVREGFVIPMGPVMEYATQKPASTIELRVYPAADGHFTLYEDTNNSYHYEKGHYATFTFNGNHAKNELSISAGKGSFPGMLKERAFKIILVGENKATGEKETIKADGTIEYNGSKIEVEL